MPSKAIDAHSIVSAAEEAFARLNKQMRGVQRRLRRMSELEAAHQHIASLEQKLVKLKNTVVTLNSCGRRSTRCANHRSAKLDKCCSRRIDYQKLFREKSENPGLRRSAPRKTSMKRGLRGVALTPEAIAAFRQRRDISLIGHASYRDAGV